MLDYEISDEDEIILRLLNLTADEEKTIKCKAEKSNKTVTEYISTLIMAYIQTV